MGVARVSGSSGVVGPPLFSEFFPEFVDVYGPRSAALPRLQPLQGMQAVQHVLQHGPGKGGGGLAVAWSGGKGGSLNSCTAAAVEVPPGLVCVCVCVCV